MRLASFNVENLFERAKVLNNATWEEGRPQLAAFERFNRTAQRRYYRKVDKRQMLADLETLRVLTRASSGGRLIRQPNLAAQLAILRENRGDFLVERRRTGVEIVATGRADWIGWLELVVEPVDEIAIRMTAKVIQDLAAGVLAVVEAEHRPSLLRFNDSMLANRYRHVMLVDGNDQRGIDVGLLTTARRPIVNVESHVDDRDTRNPDVTTRDGRLFSRDAPVFTVRCGDEDLFVVVNRLKSQSPTGDEAPTTGGRGSPPGWRRSTGGCAVTGRGTSRWSATSIVVRTATVGIHRWRRCSARRSDSSTPSACRRSTPDHGRERGSRVDRA
ncbi:MAG TPA: hypothetical protein VFO97_10465, partial [Desertimonas sp.]|nr:hypothetical protein [Desertimonas sp.]